MSPTHWPGTNDWPQWQKLLFRFFFVYFLLAIQPWTLPEYIPGVSALYTYYHKGWDGIVELANRYLFKTYSSLVYPNGSGDTSYNWTEIKLIVLLSIATTIVWSITDRRRNNYNRLAYFLRIIVRYFVALQCFTYGIIKLYAAQMNFPSLSQLATPLGDFLPMRLSWMFMGYSKTYQQFSGVMEVIAGLLLLYRRTASLGTLLAAGVFCNVMMLNLSYDIPVKIFSSQILFMCLFLLAFECKRLLQFFVWSENAVATTIYQVRFQKRWMRISRFILKLTFVILVVVMPFIQNYGYYSEEKKETKGLPIKSGVYDVEVFVLGNDTMPVSNSDSIRWKDVIFENNFNGSVNTNDTLFRQRYNRGYFNYSVDSATKELVFAKGSPSGQTFDLFRARYQNIDSNSVVLRGEIRGRPFYTLLKRTNRHYQLTERQFHWLSEYNR